MNKALEFIHKNTPVLLATVLAFAAGLLAAEATRQEPKDVYLDVETVTIKYDYSRLTRATCKTEQECNIAEAIAFHDEYKFPETIPILEPVDCSDLKGKERAACEKSNRDNAGKPATYPAICEPYIYEAPKE